MFLPRSQQWFIFFFFFFFLKGASFKPSALSDDHSYRPRWTRICSERENDSLSPTDMLSLGTRTSAQSRLQAGGSGCGGRRAGQGGGSDSCWLQIPASNPTEPEQIILCRRGHQANSRAAENEDVSVRNNEGGTMRAIFRGEKCLRSVNSSLARSINKTSE